MNDAASLTAPSRRRPGLFAPFHTSAFRYQFAADLSASWGTEMEVVVLGWYILVETNSVLLLTVFGALQYAGTLIAPALGVASDRLGHRNVLAAMRAVYAAVAVALTVLAFTGALRPWLVLVLAGTSGMIRASDTGMRSALTAEILPPDRLMGGIGLSRITTDSARIAGALAGAAVAIAIGLAPACLVLAVFHTLGCGLTCAVTPRTPPPHVEPVPARPSPWREMREGMVYVWHSPALQAALWVAFLINLAAYPWTLGLLPYAARDVLHAGQAGLGALAASFSAGGLAGSLLIGLLGRRIPAARAMLLGAALWHALLLVFIHMPSLPSACAALVLAGMAQNICMVPLMVLLLRIAGERFRGRVMGVRMLAIYGLPMGLLIAGMIIPRLGFRETAILYCAGGLAAIFVIGWHWRAALWPRALAVNTGQA